MGYSNDITCQVNQSTNNINNMYSSQSNVNSFHYEINVIDLMIRDSNVQIKSI